MEQAKLLCEALKLSQRLREAAVHRNDSLGKELKMTAFHLEQGVDRMMDIVFERPHLVRKKSNRATPALRLVK